MRVTDNYVFFWDGYLSNWHLAEFKAQLEPEGEIFDFNCSEQYFIASKAHLFNDWNSLSKIMRSKSPAEQKSFGKKVSGFNEQVWKNNRLDIMYRACYEKFSQNKDLFELLINSNNKILVEASPLDKIWGIGLHYDDDNCLDESKWNGENLLGIVLMRVRDTLTEKERYSWRKKWQ